MEPNPHPPGRAAVRVPLGRELGNIPWAELAAVLLGNGATRRRFIMWYSENVSMAKRRLMEMSFLLFALVMLLLLIYVHKRHVREPVCANTIRSQLQITNQTNFNEFQHTIIRVQVYLPWNHTNSDEKSFISGDDHEELESSPWLLSYQTKIDQGILIEEVEYAQEVGMLFLSTNTRKNLSIPVKTITFSALDDCFNEPMFLFEFLSFDALMLNIFYQTFRTGYVAVGEEIYRLGRYEYQEDVDVRVTNLMYCFTLYPALFAILAQTARVSVIASEVFVLRASALSRLRNRLTPHQVQQFIRGLPLLFLLVTVVPFGVEVLMENFVEDLRVSCCIMLMFYFVSFCRLVCLKTFESTQFLNGFFFVYFAAFSSYIYLFPLGFHGLALAVLSLCVIHLVVFFFHHFELPTQQPVPPERH